MLIGYARVSTLEQNEARQIEYLQEINCEKIFVDKYTGATNDRPKLNELREFARENDTIVVFELSRLGRNLKNVLDIIDFFLEKGVNIDIKGIGKIEKNSIMQRLFLQVVGAVSEFQRNYIREAQAQGIKIAKEQGIYKRPKKSTRFTRLNHHEVKEQFLMGIPIAKIARMHGVGRNTIYKSLEYSKKEKEIKENEVKYQKYF